MPWKVLWRIIHLIKPTLLKSPFTTFFSSAFYVARQIPARRPHSLGPLSIPPQPSQSTAAHRPSFLSPRQFISTQDPPDPRAEEGLPWLSRLPRCPSPSAQQEPGRAALTPAKPASSASGRGGRAAGSYDRRQESRMALAKRRRGEEPPKMERRQV